ncbi:MAG TPA: hypothetical protein PK875_10915, partial [Spirochaetota bacterium]|nr:hypothetical protein [Spirochaetota bacterium]
CRVCRWTNAVHCGVIRIRPRRTADGGRARKRGMEHRTVTTKGAHFIMENTVLGVLERLLPCIWTL